MQLQGPLLCVLLAIAACIAAPTESNAQRMARGLPPSRPKFVRTLPGFARSPFLPTPIDAAKRHNPSSTPPSTFSGHIQVRTKEGSVLGNVWDAPLGGVDFINPNGGLQVKFTVSLSNPTQFDIIATTPNFPSPPFIGLAGGSIGVGSGNTLGFTNVAQTPPGSRPVNGVESAVWSFNPNTKQLIPQWINPDGSKPITIIGYDIRENGFVITNDINRWEAEHPDFFISPVDFFLTS